MKKYTEKTAYISHAWLGVVTSLILFVVCFTGSIAIFHDEIEQWEQVGRRHSQSTQTQLPLEKLVAIGRSYNDMAANFSFTIPSSHNNTMLFRVEKNGKKNDIVISAINGEILPERRSDIAHILSRIHKDLDLPKPYGRYLVGLTGVIFLYLIVTAIIQHKHIFKNVFRFRFGGKHTKRLRLSISDLHKILGFWGLIFQTMIAFTGTVLGLVGLILLVMAFAAYKGDQQAALESFLGKTSQKTGITVPMQDMQSLIDVAQKYKEGIEANYIEVKNYGDQAAQVNISTESTKRLTAPIISLLAATGEVTFISDFRKIGIGAAIYNASSKLHYAKFGGNVIQWLYFILGMAMSGMGISGMMMWLERQQKNQGKHAFFSRLTIGVVVGLVVATIALFFTSMAYPEGWANKVQLQHKTYYLTWILMIILAYATPSIRSYLRLGLGICGLLCLSAPLLNAWVTKQSVFYNLQHQQFAVMGVDLTLLIIGVITLFIWRATAEIILDQ